MSATQPHLAAATTTDLKTQAAGATGATSRKSKKKKTKSKKAGVVKTKVENSTVVMLRKWMEDARSQRFLNSSNIAEEAESTGHYNHHLVGIRDQVFKKMGVFDKIGFTKVLHGAASLIETGTGNCGELSGYVYLQALKNSIDNKTLAILSFDRPISTDSHQCFIFGFQRNADGSHKKPPFNDDTLFVDPWYNTIYTYKEIKESDELMDIYFADVVGFTMYPELGPSQQKEVEDPKRLDEVSRQFSEQLEKQLLADVIPTVDNTTSVGTILSSSVKYLVATKTATEFLAERLLIEVQNKNQDEAKMNRMFRLLKHLDPKNLVLTSYSLANVYLFLARRPNIYKTKPLCIELLIKAYEAAAATIGSQTTFVQTNVCQLISALTAKDPNLLIKLPENIKKSLAAAKALCTEANTKVNTEAAATATAASTQPLMLLSAAAAAVGTAGATSIATPSTLDNGKAAAASVDFSTKGSKPTG